MPDRAPNAVALRGSWLAFAPAVFLGAFLVFQIQPLVAKRILPWFGGTPSVWATCLVVFQVLLLGGYLWAHALSRFTVRVQVVAHTLLLLVAAGVSVVPADSWKPEGGESPLLRIVLLLGASVALPYFALSATGPLLQSWAWRAERGRSPYPLYALSNTGSLLALVSYPFVFEPVFAATTQAALWRGAFVVLIGLCAFAGYRAFRAPAPSPVERAQSSEATKPPSPRRRALWFAWSALGVMLFMAVTNQLTLNVASVPFLWILPLGLYLVTFILAFSGPRVYPRRLSGPMLTLAVVLLYVLLRSEIAYAQGEGSALPIALQVALYAVALFLACFVCHGELHRFRPGPERLTGFYVSVAAGGALGGVVVAVIAPVAFLLYQEMHLAMLGCCLLWLLTRMYNHDTSASPRRAQLTAVVSLLGVVALAGMLWSQTSSLLEGARQTRRNFFGVLRVLETGEESPQGAALALYDGAILHGYQMLQPDMRRLPTTYYTPLTGGGHLLSTQLARPRRVGVVGLGAGTLATYGRRGDYFRFYEINPDVIDLARTEFSYLESCPSQWEIVLGDARLNLEREPAQRFDVLVLDAFSSDSVPVHLLTVEAFGVYDKHLAPDGVLALNVSNLHLDLARLVYRQARSRGFETLQVINKDRRDRLTLASSWMLLSRDRDPLKEIRDQLLPRAERGELSLVAGSDEVYAGIRPWTDDYSNLFQLLQ